MSSEFWTDFYRFFCVSLAVFGILALPIFLVMHNEHLKAFSVAFLSIIAVLLLFNLDKVESYKADFSEVGSLEVQLRKTVAEGQATIKQLRQVALAMSAQIYNDIAFHGQVFTRISYESLYERKTDLDESLQLIGATPAEIQKASLIWHLVTGRQMAALIFSDEGGLQEPEQEKWKELKKPYYDEEEDVPPQKIEIFIKDNNLGTPFRLKRLEDYKLYYETKKIKHPENFPVGMGIPD